ncbi:uncharacterized protein GBIM_16642 [Gryllus bimaculatus]|nr:uncharacterized protein GBIM_16642 [Gryllus bimaculatus]
MDSAEQVALSHKFEAGLKHRFLDARRFGEGAPGESDPLLDANGDQGLNTTVSAILLPPGISDSNPDVMNAIKWSEQLDPLFVSNYEMDPSLSWQYFGSASGFLRRYPASRWPGGAGERPTDFRSAAWYAGAAASPKDVLVLLDSSGSMSGARREAAKAVVASILDMLGDNDFVNVYRFSDVTEELVPCFRDMLVQATRENIRELKNALEATKSENIANFSSALITAFELLHRYNRTGLGCQCNQAIALVTDGPSDTFSDIFKRYNEPHRPVRMFTFLVGGDSAGAKEMRSIACSNKGFYARVGSRKEAESAVLNMLYVMARPMVMYQNDHPVQWTPVYAGTRQGERVANLLGVVGTDVPVEHIQKLVQPYKLGVNGYSFIVDNNGHVLYHPDLRPLS